MNLQELRSIVPTPPPERKAPRGIVRFFEASAVVAVALLGYSVYSGMIELPFWKPEPASLQR